MNKLSQYLVDNILNEVEEGITVMLPGGFKPPHEGHFQLAKGYEEMPQVKEVVILIGPKDRDGITVEDSVEIWKMLVSNIPNIRIEKSKYPSPLLSAYKYIENDAKSGQSYALGSSSKGSDYDRIRGFVDQHQEDGKYYKDGVAVVELPLEKSNPLLYRGRTDDENSKPISASQLRADLAANDFENFKTNYPSIKSTSELQTIYDLLTKKKMKEDSQDISQSTLDENKLKDYAQKLKSSFKSFIDKIKQEGQETKEAFIKLTDAVKNGEKLTKQERTEIGDQLKDTLKLAGFGAASVLPGGVIYLLLARLPLLKKTMTPSSFLEEDITLPVNIGDTVLMGKFKNKKVVVKSVSKNEKGDLQINGRPALKFRIPKKKVAEVADYKSRDRYAVDSKEEQKWMSSMVDYLISINKRQHEADPEDITDFVTKNIEYQKDKEKSKEITAYLTWRLIDGESLNEAQNSNTIDGLNHMALGDLERVADYANMIKIRMSQGQQLDAWMYSKLSDSVKNLNSVHDTMDGSDGVIEPKIGPQQVNENRKALNEGGAAGHMAHPYEDMDMTFDDIDAMIDAALSGKVEYAQEKLDGQNLMMTYKDGQALAARKKSQFKNKAETAYTKDQFEKSGAHWPDNVKLSFYEAFNDMAAAMEKLTPEDKEEFFGNGSKFVNFEILHPKNPNAVAYGVSEIRLHNVQEYDENGNITGTDPQAATKLTQALAQVDAQKQGTYEIRSTDLISLKQTKDYEKQKKELLKSVDKVRQTYGLSKKDKLGLYFQNFWSEFIKNNAKTYKYDIPDDVLQNIINRWAFGIKTPRSPMLKKTIDNPEFKQWFDDMDKKKESIRDQKKIAVQPVEDIFLKLGIFVLESIEGLIAINPNKIVANTKKELASAIEQIKIQSTNGKIGDDDAPLRFLRSELKRLERLGGFDAIVPTEGVVFKHKGKVYKLTGTFAPINQIIGYIKFGR